MSGTPCQCCESRVGLAEIAKQRNVRHFAEMIFTCFSIRICDGIDSETAICRSCIRKLKHSYNFKRLIEKSQINLMAVNLSAVAVERCPKEESPHEPIVILKENDSLLELNVKKEEFLSDHYNDMHLNESNNGCSMSVVEKMIPKEFPCELCDKTFSNCKDLNFHKKSHVTLRCHVCDKEVKRVYFSRHVKVHTDEGPYHCPVCKVRFSTLTRRNCHLRDAHGKDVYRYKCKACPKQFMLKFQYSNHLSRVHKKVLNAVCDECGYRCFSKNDLKDHMIRHQGSEAEAYQCDVCSRSYHRRSTLVDHMKIHFQYRAKKCHVCGRGFTQACSLRGHLLKVHKLPPDK